MPTTSIAPISTREFVDLVLERPGAALVMFSATWCQPCKKLAPILAKFAEDHPGLPVYKVDIDQSPRLANIYSVMQVPTVLLFSNGELAAQLPSQITRRVLESELEAWL